MPAEHSDFSAFVTAKVMAFDDLSREQQDRASMFHTLFPQIVAARLRDESVSPNAPFPAILYTAFQCIAAIQSEHERSEQVKRDAEAAKEKARKKAKATENRRKWEETYTRKQQRHGFNSNFDGETYESARKRQTYTSQQEDDDEATYKHFECDDDSLRDFFAKYRNFGDSQGQRARQQAPPRPKTPPPPPPPPPPKPKPKMTEREEFYAVLAVSPLASFETMKAAYKITIIKYHPDKNPDCSPTQTAENYRITKILTEQYTRLKNLNKSR